MHSTPAAPDLDRLFASDDEPESQDGAMLSAGKVLSQPVDRKSTDPSSDFEDDDEDEETRVLDTRELGFARESRRVDPSLKSALRSSFVPPPPTPLGSRRLHVVRLPQELPGEGDVDHAECGGHQPWRFAPPGVGGGPQDRTDRHTEVGGG